MRIIYNGIDLMPLETHEYLWQAVFDDSMTNYLYTRVSILVTAVINSQSIRTPGPGGGSTSIINPFMNYAFVGPAGPVNAGRDRTPPGPVPAGPDLAPPAAAGVDTTFPDGPLRPITNSASDPLNPFDPSRSPITTLSTIRHRLTQPRGQLFVFAGPGMETGTPLPGSSNPPNATDLSLTSPKLGAVCDAKNGPTPRVIGDVVAVGDAQTLIVDWGCETFINEAQTNNVSPSGALVSNQFRQTHVVDDSGYTILVTEGEGIFRTDLLAPFGSNPDTFRAKLFMPIPQGFTRKVDYVTPRPDISGFAYGYTDTQVPVNFVAGPFANAAHIAVLHRQAMTSDTDVFGSALAAVERTTSLLLQGKWLRQSDAAGAARAASKAGTLPNRLMVPGGKKPGP